MLGILLLIISIVLYLNGNKRWSLLLFISYSSGGFTLLTDGVLGFKNQDLALLYTFFVFAFSSLKERKAYCRDKKLEKAIWLFVFFLAISFFYSLVHYQLSLYQAFQGSRRFMIIVSYFFLCKTKKEDVLWLVDKIIVITVITSVLYNIQSITGLYVLPDADIFESGDAVEGTFRFYNTPPYLGFVLFVLVFHGVSYSKRKRGLFICLLLVSLICSQGRTSMIATVVALLFGLYLRGKKKEMIMYPLIVGFCLLPFSGMILSRFGGDSDTGAQFTSLVNGDFTAAGMGDEDVSGSMVFRLAWVVERMYYLSGRPLSENLFGLGFISDTNPGFVDKRYKFLIGNKRADGVGVTQLSTPDIAYGNILSKLGYLGGFLYLHIWAIVMIRAYKNRQKHIFLFCLFLACVSTTIGAFAGAGLSYTEKFSFPFLVLVLGRCLGDACVRKTVSANGDESSLHV